MISSVDALKFFLAKAQETGTQLEAADFQALLWRAHNLFPETFVRVGHFMVEPVSLKYYVDNQDTVVSLRADLPYDRLEKIWEER